MYIYIYIPQIALAIGVLTVLLRGLDVFVTPSTAAGEQRLFIFIANTRSDLKNASYVFHILKEILQKAFMFIANIAPATSQRQIVSSTLSSWELVPHLTWKIIKNYQILSDSVRNGSVRAETRQN